MLIEETPECFMLPLRFREGHHRPAGCAVAAVGGSGSWELEGECIRMKKAQTVKEKSRREPRHLVDLPCKDARAFLLKEESYCKFSLPEYFRFDNLLCAIANSLGQNSVAGVQAKSPREYDNVNHIILDNKDGQYAWRPLELIPPALYVSLVNNITKKDHWTLIRKRFHQFGEDSRVKCLSLPVESASDQPAIPPRQFDNSIEQVQVSLQGRMRGTGIHRVGELVGQLGISPGVFPVKVQ